MAIEPFTDNMLPQDAADNKQLQCPKMQQRTLTEPSTDSSDTEVTSDALEKAPLQRDRRFCWFQNRTRPSTPLPWMKRMHFPEGEEWVKGVVFSTRWVGLVLIINVILFIVAVVMGYSGSRSSNDKSTMSTAIYDGRCSVSGGWATGLHALINILSTALLATSSYTMQCLSAPSREDIDKAHAKGEWLDVGTFSYRNVAAMDIRRKVIWLVLLLTSIPIHLMYNSVVFSSMATNLYGIVFIPDDLGINEPIYADNRTAGLIGDALGYRAQELQMEIFNGTLRNLTLQDCVDAYAVEYNTHRKTLVLVADRKYFRNFSSLRSYYEDSSQSYYAYNSYRYSWMCSEHPPSCTKDGVMGLIDQSQWTVFAQHWEYRNWIFDAPAWDGTMRIFSCQYNELGAVYDKNLDPMETSLGNDLKTLCYYVALQNPNQEQLDAYLSTPAHWRNGSWASQVSYRWENYTRYIAGVGPAPVINIPISHCMSKEVDERCQLLFSLPIGLVVIMCNVIKLVFICLAVNTKRKEIFLTVGDAIASFLAEPDPATRHLLYVQSQVDVDRCSQEHMSMGRRVTSWVSRNLCSHGRTRSSFLIATDSSSRPIPSRRKRWYQAASPEHWTILLFIIISSFTASTILFYIGSGTRYHNEVTLKTSWEVGFGKPSSVAMIGQAAQSVMQAVLLSNTPQLLLSIIYFLSNSILTNMLVAAEYNDYAIHRKPLRVSWPRAQQRSTRYLSLPYRYRGPFVVVAVALHWLISQSLFFLQVRVFDIDGTVIDRWSTTRCGYSLVALLTTIIVGAIATIAFLVLGLRKYKSNMPLPLYSSVEISAACHPPQDDKDSALKPVMWGAVAESKLDQSLTELRYYTFTSKEVIPPDHCS
ncbi:hypothetical protein EYZ11_000569 [Aspergillus tanneri]|uniref:DUF6536 domain-containing protein n=1 Tax=Aspergillus tanneri TaxID=1220188 RepID=A0A4V3UQT8_9EURO|nr:hypothetical protein EYZ11_000569 [Aspergillus tanneri]